MTREEIAKALGVHPKRVLEIEKGALKKLSSPKFRKKWADIRETMGLIGSRESGFWALSREVEKG